MAGLKTQPNEASAAEFLEKVEDDQRREDAIAVCELMERVSGEAPKMWGSAIIGFGSYHYRYASGREGDWFITGLSPRKAYLSIYIMPGYGEFQEVMDRLSKFKQGKSCLNIKRLSDIDMTVLEELVDKSIKLMRAKYPQ